MASAPITHVKTPTGTGSLRLWLRLAASSALMALGVVALAVVILAFSQLGHLSATLAEAGLRFAFADSLVRGDMLRDLAFECSALWSLVMLVILWRRALRVVTSTQSPAGGQHGN